MEKEEGMRVTMMTLADIEVSYSITTFWWDDGFVAAVHRDKGVALWLNQLVIHHVPESRLESDYWSWHVQIL